jgi:DNA-binding winged helix-turn-helix (wHTH) protein
VITMAGMAVAATRVRFGPFEADLRTAELWKNGTRLRLQEQPFQVLAMLLERPGELVTRDDLRQRLWPADTFVDFDHSLNTAINKLRDVLGDSAADPRYIETLARRGYRFVAVVTAAGEGAAAAPVTSAESTDHDELPRPPRPLPRGLLVLIQLMYLVFYLVALSRLGRVETTHAYLGASFLRTLVIVIIVTGAIGIAARLYWLACVLFDFRGTARQFLRAFPALAVLDELWALAPLLLWTRIGIGLAFAAMAALLFLPFAQRNLVRMAYERPRV